MPTPPPRTTTDILPIASDRRRLKDETGEYEIIDRPYTTAGGKTANVRVRRVDSDVQIIRTYGAHERVAVEHA